MGTCSPGGAKDPMCLSVNKCLRTQRQDRLAGVSVTSARWHSFSQQTIKSPLLKSSVTEGSQRYIQLCSSFGTWRLNKNLQKTVPSILSPTQLSNLSSSTSLPLHSKPVSSLAGTHYCNCFLNYYSASIFDTPQTQHGSLYCHFFKVCFLAPHQSTVLEFQCSSSWRQIAGFKPHLQHSLAVSTLDKIP